MNELAKIDSFRKDLALAETIEEIKFIGNATEAYQQLMITQKVAKKSIDEIGEFDIEIKEKEAEWLNTFYPRKGTGANQYKSAEIPKRNLSKMPVSLKESAMVRRIKREQKEKPEKVRAIKEMIKKSKKPLNAKTLENELKKIGKEEQIEKETKKRKQEHKYPLMPAYIY